MIRAMLFVLLPIYAFAADVTGQWNVKLIRYGEEAGAARIELKAEGTKVTGTLNKRTLEKMGITLTERQKTM